MFPSDLRYTADHEWVRRISGTVLRFGITQYAAEALGDVVFVQAPAVGTEIVAGQPCGEVESTKSVSDLYAPATGTVVAVNEDLDGSPETVNADPYGDGWMVEVEIASQQEADRMWAGLLDAAAYSGSLPA